MVGSKNVYISLWCATMHASNVENHCFRLHLIRKWWLNEEPALGLIHMIHFGTQYCDIAMKRKKDIAIKRFFFLQNIVVTFQNHFK